MYVGAYSDSLKERKKKTAALSSRGGDFLVITTIRFLTYRSGSRGGLAGQPTERPTDQPIKDALVDETASAVRFSVVTSRCASGMIGMHSPPPRSLVIYLVRTCGRDRTVQ